MSRHRYGTAAPQWCELSVPDGDEPHPVCILVHGGFWKADYGADLMDDLAADLVERGWAAWNVEYRRLDPGPDDQRGGDWPAMFEDVAAAVDLLAEVAVEHGLDLARVGVAGHSAGGHLAAWIAARPSLPAGAPGADPQVVVHAAVLQAGVLDLARKAGEDDEGARLVGALIEAPEPDRLAITSPQAMLPLGVPVLCVHGGDDDVVVPGYSEAFVEAAREAGDDAAFVQFDDEDHMGHVVALNPLWRVAAGWLDRHLVDDD